MKIKVKPKKAYVATEIVERSGRQIHLFLNYQMKLTSMNTKLKNIFESQFHQDFVTPLFKETYLKP